MQMAPIGPGGITLNVEFLTTWGGRKTMCANLRTGDGLKKMFVHPRTGDGQKTIVRAPQDWRQSENDLGAP